MKYAIVRNNLWSIDGDDYSENPDIITDEYSMLGMDEDDDLEDIPENYIGSLRVDTISLRYKDDDEELSNQMDSTSQELDELYPLIDELQGEFTETIAYISNVKINSEHRGKKLALKFINGVINSMIKGGVYGIRVVLLPCPILISGLTEDEARNFIEVGIPKLKNHYAQLGFKEIADKYMYLDIT